MFDNLLKIYAGKIITDIQSFEQDKYYYFYSETGTIFGISKSITPNEYQLIKSIYLEKTFYYNDVIAEKFHEYIFENQPFPNAQYNKIRFFLLKDVGPEVSEQALNILKDVLGDIVALKNRDYHIIFYFDNFDFHLEDLFYTLGDDFSVEFNVHMGYYFYSDTVGSDIAKYIYAFMNSRTLQDVHYSTFVDLVLSSQGGEDKELVEIIRKAIMRKLDQETEDIIRAFFKNNLNVSQTAKLSYLHRNSLLNKIDNISKETGLNIQQFSDACVMNRLLNVK